MLPYGIEDLVPPPRHGNPAAQLVKCYVRSCTHFLRVAGRQRLGDVCPDHGIRCHLSQGGATYAFSDASRNAMVAPRFLAERVIGHPLKYESHRLGAERSEDALTWNVFRSLFEAQRLKLVAQLVTGELVDQEPVLYLWGMEIRTDDVGHWPLLHVARRRFESNLPVERPLTEPDIALHLPGKYLILIEAKFTSPNSYSEPGWRKSAQSLTSEEFLAIYREPSLPLFEKAIAAQGAKLHQQLWRNLLFAAWMAREEGRHTEFFHANLVRESAEQQSCQDFSGMICLTHRNRFVRICWEDLYRAVLDEPQLAGLRHYLRTKSAGLKAAFPSLAVQTNAKGELK
jgi:hypothetical protein